MMSGSIRLFKKLSTNWGVDVVRNATQTTLNILTTSSTIVFGQIFRAINVVTNCESTFKIQPGKRDIQAGSILLSGSPDKPKRMIGTIISYQTFYKNREEATEFVVLKNREVFSILLWETDRNVRWHTINE